MGEYEIATERIGGFDIEVVDTGDEDTPAIVFAHGLGGNLRQWEQQISYFNSRYRVIAFSLQGHGYSSKPDDEAAYEIGAYGDVVLSLLKSKKINSCFWIGNSMGGVIGYEIMKREQNIIKHLITNGTAPKLKYSKSMLKLIAVMDRVLIAILGFERYISIAVNASLKESSKRMVLKGLFLQAHPKAVMSSHQLLGNYDYLDVIRTMNNQVTFILTPNDKDINKEINKYRNQLESMKNVCFVEQSNGGHVFNIESPNQYNMLVESIIN